MTRFLAAGVAGALLATGAASAQEPTAQMAGHAFELRVTDRWLHGGQRAEFTRWSEPNPLWLAIDSVRPGPEPGSRVLHIGGPGRLATVEQDADGRLRRVELVLPHPPWEQAAGELTSAAARIPVGSRFRPGSGAGIFNFASDAAELVRPFAPARLEPGATWSDTLRIDVEQGEYSRTMDGFRWNTLERDTVIAGRRLWVVRDSAELRFEERWIEGDRTLDTPVTVVRRAEGTLRGVHLFDPELGLFHERVDTMSLGGQATLGYPDGRVFSTPARYERVASWRSHDPESAAALREEQREAVRNRTVAMAPDAELERRLRAGDAALRDSLVRVWHESSDASERAMLFRAIWTGSRDDAVAVHDRLRELALAAGDTVFVLGELTYMAGSDRRLTTNDLELLLPFLRDPGMSLRFALSRDFFYESVRNRLLRSPPALEPHPALWTCEPEACQLLTDQYDAPGDPRLRDLALITRFVIDPARWEDEIARREAEGSAMVRPAARLMVGARGLAPLAASTVESPPLPEPGADWRAWLEWIGVQPIFVHLPPGAAPPRASLHVGRDHVTGIHFYQARTGRPVVEEIRRGYETAVSDSARLVFGTILFGLGERRSPADELARAILHGTEAERTLARRELPWLFAESAQPVELELALELIHRHLQILTGDEPPWPNAEPGVDPDRVRARSLPDDDRPLYILIDDLPPGVQDRWADRATPITAAEWELRTEPEAAVLLRPRPAQRVGPFVRVTAGIEATVPPGSTGYRSRSLFSETITLLETPDGWVQVDGIVLIS